MLVPMPSAEELIVRRFDRLNGWHRCNVRLTSEYHDGIRMWQVADHVWEDEEELAHVIEMAVCAP